MALWIRTFLEVVNELVEKGILSDELCPEPNYWHWSVLIPDQLPIQFKDNYEKYGEIRLY